MSFEIVYKLIFIYIYKKLFVLIIIIISLYRSDSLPNKITVTSEDCELPKPISPPAQLEELNPTITVSLALPSFIK